MRKIESNKNRQAMHYLPEIAKCFFLRQAGIFEKV